MTTAFISDIHGNYEALQSVLASIDAMGIASIVCAGDVAGYYSEVNACCDTLRARGIPTVMGNHDWYLGGGGRCLRSRSVNECLRFQRQIISADNLEWLRNLPLQLEVDGVRVVHGGWSDPLDEYLEPSAEYFTELDGQYFLTGHTHTPCVQRFGDKTYCNPGSVGQPRDNDPRASFAVFDGLGFQIHRVEYDFTKVGRLMDAAGFSDYFYGGLATGARRLRRP